MSDNQLFTDNQGYEYACCCVLTLLSSLMTWCVCKGVMASTMIFRWGMRNEPLTEKNIKMRKGNNICKELSKTQGAFDFRCLKWSRCSCMFFHLVSFGQSPGERRGQEVEGREMTGGFLERGVPCSYSSSFLKDSLFKEKREETKNEWKVDRQVLGRERKEKERKDEGRHVQHMDDVSEWERGKNK